MLDCATASDGGSLSTTTAAAAAAGTAGDTGSDTDTTAAAAGSISSAAPTSAGLEAACAGAGAGAGAGVGAAGVSARRCTRASLSAMERTKWTSTKPSAFFGHTSIVANFATMSGPTVPVVRQAHTCTDTNARTFVALGDGGVVLAHGHSLRAHACGHVKAHRVDATHFELGRQRHPAATQSANSNKAERNGATCQTCRCW